MALLRAAQLGCPRAFVQCTSTSWRPDSSAMHAATATLRCLSGLSVQLNSVAQARNFLQPQPQQDDKYVWQLLCHGPSSVQTQQRFTRKYTTASPIASAAQLDGAQDAAMSENSQPEPRHQQQNTYNKRKRPALFSGVYEQPEQPPSQVANEPAAPQASKLQSTEEQQHQQEQEDLQSMTMPAEAVQDVQSMQQVRQQQQQQQQSTARRKLFVFWDLDNKHPSEWLQMPDVIENIKESLHQFGSIHSISAYSNINTLTWVVPGAMGGASYNGFDADTASMRDLAGIVPGPAIQTTSAAQSDFWGMDVLEDEIMAEDGLRCPLCGKRCKSITDRNKHFEKLHRREHQKKLAGGSGRKKAIQKYLDSDKAQRYRQAVQEMAMPIANLSGGKGQRVKLLLQKYGVTLKEVSNARQAVDVMMKERITYLASMLRAQEAADREPQEPAKKNQSTAPSKTAVQAKQASSVLNIGSAVMSDSVLVLVTDDRGFRDTAANWLHGGGAGVVLVTDRQPEEWDAKWKMSEDERVQWVFWYRASVTLSRDSDGRIWSS